MTMLHKQHGSTLLVALVMLILLTLVALSAMNASTTSIEVVGNAQLREEASAAAQKAIEGVISTDFTISPAASSVEVYVGGTKYIAAVAVPTCINSLPALKTDPDVNTPGDEDCFTNSNTVKKITFNPSGDPTTSVSYSCNRQTWEVTAIVNNSDSGANTNVHQGISRLVDAGKDCP